MFACAAAGATVARFAASSRCPGRILSDHAHAFGQLVHRVEHLFCELVEQLVQVAKERTEGLPVVVLVVDVQHERVRDLAPQLLHDGIVGVVLARQLTGERAGVSGFGCAWHGAGERKSRAALAAVGGRESVRRVRTNAGYNDARYAAIAIMSSGLSFDTTGCMIALCREPR